MKIKIITILSFVLLSGLMVLYDSWQQPSLKPYQPSKNQSSLMKLPPITARHLVNKNQQIDLSDISEDIILLNFWASWCTVCMAEMDEMFDLIADMDGKVALVTISIDDNQKHALKAYNFFKNRYKKTINSPHIYWGWDKDKTISLKTFNVNKTPETIIINRQRFMVDKIIGAYDWSGSRIRKQLKQLIQ